MSLNHKQFTYLKEMGIDLWQRKNLSSVQNADTQHCVAEQESAISLDKLKHSTFFTDVVLAISGKSEQTTLISQQENLLLVGDIQWRFSADQQLSFADGLLTTPALSYIAQTSEAKRALWQLLQTHQLVNN